MLTAISYVVDRFADDETASKQQDKKSLVISGIYSASVLGAIYLAGLLFWGLGRMNGTW
ncbi:MAG TPA: hypothetical protein HPQ04_09080 [Rhodospirillaceae bacterium]|nr:hypothetical protein [Rhodospirillaceae bacterium]